jgi:hydroxymethylpyrimidine/phosphomethylpyrimidine kinase
LVTIAGWDPLGSAGVLRDLETFSALSKATGKCRNGMSAAITMLTAQNNMEGIKHVQIAIEQCLDAQLKSIFYVWNFKVSFKLLLLLYLFGN